MAKINSKLLQGQIDNLEGLKKKAEEQGNTGGVEFFEKKIAELKARQGGKQNKFNAKKIIIDDIQFDSTREGEFYKFLKNKGYNFQMQVSFTLMEGFRLETEGAIQDIKLAVDFLIEDEYLVDIKGMVTEEFNLKWKLLKNIHRDNYIYRKIVTTSERIALEHEIDKALDKRYKLL